MPVHLLTSSTTATTPPAPTGSTTALGYPDSHGCTIDSTFYADGAQVRQKWASDTFIQIFVTWESFTVNEHDWKNWLKVIAVSSSSTSTGSMAHAVPRPIKWLIFRHLCHRLFFYSLKNPFSSDHFQHIQSSLSWLSNGPFPFLDTNDNITNLYSGDTP